MLVYPGFCFSESKLDIAKEIYFDESGYQDTIQKLNKEMAERRNLIIELFKPDAGSQHLPLDLLASEEQLYHDINNSDIFRFNIQALEDSVIHEIVDFLTLQELKELRELQKHPVYKRIKPLNQRILIKISEKMNLWKNKNSLAFEEFEYRRGIIQDKKIEHLKNMTNNK